MFGFCVAAIVAGADVADVGSGGLPIVAINA